MGLQKTRGLSTVYSSFSPPCLPKTVDKTKILKKSLPLEHGMPKESFFVYRLSSLTGPFAGRQLR